MSKKHFLSLVVLVLLISGYIYVESNHLAEEGATEEVIKEAFLPIITPISHASFVLSWGDLAIFNDPVGEAELYDNLVTPDLILLSDIHGDHLSTSTLASWEEAGTKIIAPAAVAEILPVTWQDRVQVLANGEEILYSDLKITAVPMYNFPEAEDSRHTSGRGNGYLIEKDGVRLYVAGDTGPTPEMKALTAINLALVPMNPPYTMTVEEAAEAVLAFAPKQVYPYHYRTPEGFSDVERFKELINEVNPDIEVVLLEWYKE